jgi:ATP-dependent Zn protease
MLEGLLERQKSVVRGLLADNRHLVEALRDALLERHELVGREITDVLAAAGPARGVDEQLVLDLREGSAPTLRG